MEQQFQPEENQTPQTASLSAPQMSLAAETEVETQAAQIVTERLNEITRRAKRAKVWNNSFLFVMTASYPLCILAERLLRDLPDSLAMAFELSFILLLIAAVIGFIVTSLLCLLRFDAEELAKLGGLEAIGPLFAALQAPISRKQRDAIYAALTLLLPQMKASDTHFLTPAHRQTIHAWLNIGDVEFCVIRRLNGLRIAALKALEQVGDSGAIPIVERLANMRPRTTEKAKIKQAAIDCLPMLRANCGDVEAARTLLRASQAETTDPKTLLRPASGAGQTDGAELLRGTETPGTRSGSGENLS